MLKLGSHDKLGYTRLKGELYSYRSELTRTAERVEQTDEPDTSWLDDAESLLDRAETALEGGEIEEGWSYLHTARRIELDRLARDREALGLQARILLAEANALPGSWVTGTVRGLVGDGQGRPRTDGNLSLSQVRAARYLLDREHQQTHLRRRYVQEQFSGLTLLGLGSLGLFVLLTLAAAQGVGGSSVITPLDSGAETQSWFVGYVLLAGIIGASLFGIVSSIRTDPRVVTIPQTISSGWMVTARALIGAISALVLYLFIKVGILNLGGGPEVVLLISLAAGYSERLAPRALEALTDQVSSRFDRDERFTTLLGELPDTPDREPDGAAEGGTEHSTDEGSEPSGDSDGR